MKIRWLLIASTLGLSGCTTVMAVPQSSANIAQHHVARWTVNTYKVREEDVAWFVQACGGTPLSVSRYDQTRTDWIIVMPVSCDILVTQ